VAEVTGRNHAQPASLPQLGSTLILLVTPRTPFILLTQRQILSPGAARLVTVGLGDVAWNDLGDPDRVISTLQDRGFGLPAWARRWQTQNQRDRREERLSMAAAVA
jgi:hypothetical protein